MDNEILFTIKDFALLHNLNKRTLHYYDEIGLFSPIIKKENNYRYYSLNQSAELEYILALKELGMSIAEIKNYLSNPNNTNLINITNKKIEELDQRLNYFINLKDYLKIEKDAINISNKIKDGGIEIQELSEEFLYCTPISHNSDEIKDMSIVMEHLKKVWSITYFKVGCGSYINLEKIENNNFEKYDGLFSIINNVALEKNIIKREQGTYLCAYNIGSWDKIPKLYKKMLKYAKEKKLILSGNAYEIGINRLSNLTRENYITKIVIKCQETRNDWLSI